MLRGFVGPGRVHDLVLELAPPRVEAVGEHLVPVPVRVFLVAVLTGRVILRRRLPAACVQRLLLLVLVPRNSTILIVLAVTPMLVAPPLLSPFFKGRVHGARCWYG